MDESQAGASMTRIGIVAAKRTPQGRFLGALAGLSTLDLAKAAGRAALGDIDPAKVDLTILGRVLPPDFNTARYLALELDVPEDRPAFTVNMVCGSGMKAIRLGADAIALGRAKVVLCGGAESMSNTPHGLEDLRRGRKLGDGRLVDYLVQGLSDARLKKHMGEMVEGLATAYRVDREAQDRFALASHQRAIAAQRAGAFDAELVGLPELDHDEHPRADTTLERLASLKPAFVADGAITAGNASGVNDGAAIVLLCDRATAEREGWTPLAWLGDGLEVGVAPEQFGLGPARVMQAMAKAGRLDLEQLDVVEINEAFAGQVLACLRDLGLKDDDPRVNPNGGGIALGHPIGASGARLIVHLAHRIHQGLASRAVASLCVGGGQGIASVLTEAR